MILYALQILIKILFLIPKCFSTLTNVHLSILQGGMERGLRRGMIIINILIYMYLLVQYIRVRELIHLFK